MKKRLLLEIIIGLLLIIISVSIGYSLSSSKESGTSFYCTLTLINDNTLEVSGIPENDINHRGDFILPLRDNTKILTTSDQKLNIENLKEDSLLKVTYTGEYQDTYPATVSKVLEIIVIE